MSEEHLRMVEILATHSATDVALIKCMLNGTDIPYHVADENFSLVRPGIVPSRVMVAEDRVEDARKALSHLSLTFTWLDVREAKDDGEEE